jgi:hypothetical protein
MRASLLAFALLPALPAAAAVTEEIPLRYLSVVQAEQALLGFTARSPLPARQARNLDELDIFPGFVDPVTGNWYLPGFVQAARVRPDDPASHRRSLVPDGITAWTVDPQRNTLAATGEPEAVEGLKRLLRLLDVPPRRVRLAARVLQLDPEALAGLELHQLRLDVGIDPPGAPPAGREAAVLRTAVLTEAQAAALAARAARRFVETEMTVVNNGSLRLEWPQAADRPSGFSAVVPRVNGDGTITVFAPVVLRPAADGKAAAHSLFGVRRLASGQTALMVDERGLAILVTAQLLPEAPPAAE